MKIASGEDSLLPLVLSTQTDMKNSIYKVPRECKQVYIEEIKRPMENLIREHDSHIRNRKTTQSDIAEHAWTNHHKILLEEATILEKKDHWFQSKLKNAAYT